MRALYVAGKGDSMKVLVFGASGMVGTEVLHQILDDKRIEKVISINRSHLDIESPKLQQIINDDFMNYQELEGYLIEPDVCFYCLGVYQNKVSKQDFWQVTVNYLCALISTLEKVNPKITFCLFSAQGASPDEKSIFRFGNAKGRAENSLTKSTIRKKYIFRPGFINPGRKSAFSGFALKFYQFLYKIFPSLGINAIELARVMVHVGITGQEKVIFENSDLREISKNM